MDSATEVQTTPMEGVTEGQIVHYVLPDGRSKGQHRPAIIVRNWSSSDVPHSDGMVNMQVFTDGSNDYFGKGQDGNWCLTLWKTSVHYSGGKEPNTWHWIEKA